MEFFVCSRTVAVKDGPGNLDAPVGDRIMSKNSSGRYYALQNRFLLIPVFLLISELQTSLTQDSQGGQRS